MYPKRSFIIACFILSAMFLKAQVNNPADTAKAVPGNFTAVEVEASYPGGAGAWTKLLQKNLNANAPVKNGAPAGKYNVAVQFIVDKDGSVSNIKPLTKLGYGMEEELIRVIELSGKWTPAVSNGQPLKAYRKQPTTFIVDDENFQVNSKEEYTLYTNTDNEITVTAKKVKPADISILVQGGKSVPVSAGKFIVRVTKPGRVTITIVNNKKDDKEIGLASFEVKAL